MMVSVRALHSEPTNLKPTRDLGALIARLETQDMTENAKRWAKHCILDWIAVTIGGAYEPLTKKLIDVALTEGAKGPARLIGHSHGLISSQAALINGSASHALDYDDVNERMNGHPTVPLVPALMALSDEKPVRGIDFITAFVTGYEVETALAEMSGFAHYDKGWHGTATYGTFGAAAACANLMGLNDIQSTMALGIAATQAAGLKSMFGTMCKPLHAGKAASNGLLTARLASRGFTSREDAIECPQGFAATQAEGFKPLPVRPDDQAGFAVEENLFKYHAACYLTHAGIEAVKNLRDGNEIDLEDIVSIEQYVPGTHFSVCNISEPKTGLEVKFSMRHTAAMALSGIDTGSLGSYEDSIAVRADLISLRDKVKVIARNFPTRMQSEVAITLKNGQILSSFADAGVPARDLDVQEGRLIEKFQSLADPIFSESQIRTTIESCLKLDELEDVSVIFDAVSGNSLD